jgi:hypothetical protein
VSGNSTPLVDVSRTLKHLVDGGMCRSLETFKRLECACFKNRECFKVLVLETLKVETSTIHA